MFWEHDDNINGGGGGNITRTTARRRSRRTMTDKDGAIVGGTHPFLDDNNENDDMTRTCTSRGVARQCCHPHWPPGNATGRGRALGNSNPTISATTTMARTMERTRKAAMTTAKMAVVEAMVTETMRAHSRHINIKNTSYASFIYVYVTSPKPRDSTLNHEILT